MPSLTCRNVVDFLAAYLAHELEPGERAEFEAHLAVCDVCVEYLRGYERGVRLGKAAFDRLDRAAAEQVPHELVEAILAARRRGS